MTLKVTSTVGQNTTLTVNEKVFGAKANPQLSAQAVRVYLSNQRLGTSKVKTRSEIARTKKKWFKQKGTGNARHGARTANLFVGGGISHGPTGEQNWNLKMSNSMRKAALSAALSAQVKNIVVSDDLNQLDGKTSSAQRMLVKMLPEAKRLLVILPKAESLVMRSLRNLAKVVVTSSSRVTTYEVAAADGILMTKEAVKMLEERLTKEAKVKRVKTEKPVAEKKAVEKAPAKKAAAPKKATKSTKTKSSK